eukprot:scaffold299782_cov33-Tisochrysis_lutea.AAC.1
MALCTVPPAPRPISSSISSSEEETSGGGGTRCPLTATHGLPARATHASFGRYRRPAGSSASRLSESRMSSRAVHLQISSGSDTIRLLASISLRSPLRAPMDRGSAVSRLSVRMSQWTLAGTASSPRFTSLFDLNESIPRLHSLPTGSGTTSNPQPSAKSVRREEER